MSDECATLTEFRELIERAKRERWPLLRLVDAIETLPRAERDKAVQATVAAIAEELDRRRAEQRLKLDRADGPAPRPTLGDA